ncbi:ZIP family metal transporter [Glutamicibacter protophormiae]|uniref:ZIP family zinc transporter n=1 Tax=Glutamicibacter protophormiae TaxID=37930 RepID=A0ABS4XNQ1_GLUPR|nr:ZIP family zinc transporter [Glutamicibacter protophormiae]MBP2397887.1 ZIP family zinc transporter [Glutamicibacter protophormiae]QRQ78602.1 ZIP family zinc transporter [Glutamicibacter protophormiae]GGL85833.1 ZIP family zinc transporter [Glutamicibacter protophormiae]
MFVSLQALLWGTAAGSALLIGAAAAWWLRISRVWVCAVMAFGAGVLVSALSFELVLEAFTLGGLAATVAGVVAGALLYFGANTLLAKRSRRKRRARGAGGAESSSGSAIAVGALIDGIPESVALGLGLVAGASVNPTMLIAIFVSNIPEGLASSADMKASGRSGRSVFTLWASIALASGLAAFIGAIALEGMPAEVLAFTTAVAAGGILTMIADTMIPEAYAVDHDYTGLLVTAGFLSAFSLHAIGG